jgi:A/G-specific adenine glycosylase
VLVSEVMLQQTQVGRVRPHWESFMGRWPTVAACADAPVADVVRAWAGLGYNRRALNLHRCAVAVVEDHGGRFPRDVPGLLALPGVGPYTARAVLAFAFEADVAVLDVNARRVLARAGGCTDQAEADRWVPTGRGWAWNQAVLDLGATVCTARRPRCEGCPCAPACGWHGGSGPDPAARPRRQSRFEGSDRQGRGRLLDALRAGPVAAADVAAACGWPEDAVRAARVGAGLVADGLAWVGEGGWELAR